MPQKPLPTPPRELVKQPTLYAWLIKLYKRVTDEIQILWTQIDKTGSSIADLEAIDHDLLDGLSDDDHTQYHNDTRGDARYYTQAQLDGGQLDSLYYTQTLLDSGQLDNRYYTETEVDASFAPIGKGVDNGNSHDHLGGDGAQIAHSSLSGIGTNTHAQIDTHIAATNAHGATGDLVGTGDTMTTSTAGVANQIAAVADLNQTISGTYTQSEVQAISDKVDELLAAMRTANHLNT